MQNYWSILVLGCPEVTMGTQESVCVRAGNQIITGSHQTLLVLYRWLYSAHCTTHSLGPFTIPQKKKCLWGMHAVKLLFWLTNKYLPFCSMMEQGWWCIMLLHPYIHLSTNSSSIIFNHKGSLLYELFCDKF